MLLLHGFSFTSARSQWRTRGVAGTVVLSVLLVACDGVATDLSEVSEIEVLGVPAQMSPGESAQVTVVLKGTDGAVVQDHPVRLDTDGGTLDRTTGVTDAMGRVRVEWSPLKTEGAHYLFVQAGGHTFEAATRVVAPRAGAFAIDVVESSTDGRVQDALAGAIARWERVIAADLPDEVLNIAANTCGVNHQPVSGTTDDLALIVRVVPLDGPGGALASAGPCVLRPSNRLPVLGAIQIDEADVESLLERNALAGVLIHEIGHVLGLGSIWVGMGHTTGLGGADPLHVGENAVTQFASFGGNAAGVPLENFGSAGTRDVHWRESVLRSEVMTGWLTPGVINPLSRISIGALHDLGYVVDYNAADTFVGVAAPQAEQPFTVDLAVRELPHPPPILLRR